MHWPKDNNIAGYAKKIKMESGNDEAQDVIYAGFEDSNQNYFLADSMLLVDQPL